ncbi:MAG: hypothetical protein HOP26_04840 [Methylotenera sp.]|nr:hypothetical protein [Methylotenera sp.]
MNILPKRLIVLCTLLLSACASSSSGLALSKPDAKLDRAKFDAYTFQTLYSNASGVICDYGKQRIAEYDERVPPRNEVWGAGFMHGSWVVYPQLKCSWLAADGTPQQEVVKTGSGLFAKYVEWEHFEGEALLMDEPIRFKRVVFTIQIKDKQFYITREFNVQLYGERLSETEHRIKAIKVEQVIYQRQ